MNVKPGVSMGPWGLHYERTQTWWEQSKPWHEYLARCQYLLRQGRAAADICYLEPEGSPQHFSAPAAPSGYSFDDCSPAVVLSHMTVKNGRLTLPDGMNYRLLVLPDARTMTPKLLAKILALVQAGATVAGPPPVRSPSLEAYPGCDAQVRQMARTLWGGSDGKTVFSRGFGRGRVFWGKTPGEILAEAHILPDFSSAGNPNVHALHRRMADGTDLYFVANLAKSAVRTPCVFRVQGKSPEFWWPETGRMEPAAEYVRGQGTMTVPISLDAAQSVFVVFRPYPKGEDNVVSLTRNGVSLELPQKDSIPVIVKASYGVLSDPAKTRDVRAKLQALIAGGSPEFQVSALAAGDDPAFGIVKTLQVDYTIKGRAYHAQGQDPDTLDLSVPGFSEPTKLTVTPDHGLRLTAWKTGSILCGWLRERLRPAGLRPFPRLAKFPAPGL